MKITLLGDSIRQQYAPRVKELIGDDFEVWYPADNCRFSKYTLRGLFDWRTQMEGTDIVHWNNGLWDTCNLFGDGPFSTEEEYVENMLRIADILLSRYDKVIFATTTPVRNGNLHNHNEGISRYNSLIVPLLEEKGVIINDLYSLVSEDIDKYIRSDDTIHLTEDGINVCAQKVKDVILTVAKTVDKEKSTEAEFAHANSVGAPV
jgi:lysophospholipase L1-like esterase